MLNTANQRSHYSYLLGTEFTGTIEIPEFPTDAAVEHLPWG